MSFSFNTGFQGANVWRNYLYVLPMIKGKLPGTPPAAGEGLEVNPGGQTVYDPIAQVTWLADANLAAKQTFGVADINPDGSMEHTAAVQWVAAMNKADQGRGYLGQTDWQLPETGPPDPSCSMKGTTGFDCTGSAMGELFYKQLGLHRGESVVAAPDVKVGPFHDIQPYLYWACEAETASIPLPDLWARRRVRVEFFLWERLRGTNLLANRFVRDCLLPRCQVAYRRPRRRMFGTTPPQTPQVQIWSYIITAGGVVFIAGTTDSFIRGFDVETGKELWKAKLPASANATPMTYSLGANGKQYLVIAAGGHPKITEESLSDTLVAFTLP